MIPIIDLIITVNKHDLGGCHNKKRCSSYSDVTSYPLQSLHAIQKNTLKTLLYLLVKNSPVCKTQKVLQVKMLTHADIVDRMLGD